MRTHLIKAILLSALVALPVACGRKSEPNLMTVESTNAGPDEFAILPGRPLEIPEEVSQLPTPTPGGGNLTDPDPMADAVAALGGQSGVLQRDGSSGPDGGLLTHTGRFGVSANIRTALAAEDLDFRRNNRGRLLERWFNVNVYFRKYAPQSLDQHAELARMRRLGIRTPAAPPEGLVLN